MSDTDTKECQVLSLLEYAARVIEDPSASARKVKAASDVWNFYVELEAQEHSHADQKAV